MHKYLMTIDKYFGGAYSFEIEAENKNQALEIAKNSKFYKSDFAKSDTLRCVGKLKPSYKKIGEK